MTFGYRVNLPSVMLKANVGAPELVEGPGEVLGMPSNDEREIDKEMIKILWGANT